MRCWYSLSHGFSWSKAHFRHLWLHRALCSTTLRSSAAALNDEVPPDPDDDDEVAEEVETKAKLRGKRIRSEPPMLRSRRLGRGSKAASSTNQMSARY